MKKNDQTTVITVTIAFAMSCLFLTSCEPRLTPADVAFAEPILDNILHSMKDRDYLKFSGDLSDAMKEAIEKIGFETMLVDSERSLGGYQGRKFKKAVKAKAKGMDLVIITYQGHFEKDDNAIITIYLSDADGVKKVEGFATALSGGAR